LPVKAVLFDYIGTLVEPCNYSLHESKLKLHSALCEVGLVTNEKEFLIAYTKAHEKYRLVRYKQLQEVTNAVWVCEALNNIQCFVTLNDSRLKSALNVFFQDFINSLKLRPHAKKLIKTASETCKVGLVSNFTYAPAIYASLRKLHIHQFFHAILVSESIGWRKPHQIMFNKALDMLQVKPDETFFIGDSPIEDIKGAQKAGLRTIFVVSAFNNLIDLGKHHVKPGMSAQDLKEVCKRLPKLT
jgi:HAD superfamily hydrolase (TIGR01549 family)